MTPEESIRIVWAVLSSVSLVVQVERQSVAVAQLGREVF